jgi:hypothetical protein
MFSTENQRELNAALNVMFEDQGAAFTAGYMNSMAQEMLNLLPKRKQKEFIKSVEAFNGRQLVKVKNLMSGAEVEIRRADRGSCVDPSTERYWSM